MLLLTDRPFRPDLFEKSSSCFLNKVFAAIWAGEERVDCDKNRAGWGVPGRHGFTFRCRGQRRWDRKAVRSFFFLIGLRSLPTCQQHRMCGIWEWKGEEEWDDIQGRGTHTERRLSAASTLHRRRATRHAAWEVSVTWSHGVHFWLWHPLPPSLYPLWLLLSHVKLIWKMGLMQNVLGTDTVNPWTGFAPPGNTAEVVYQDRPEHQGRHAARAAAVDGGMWPQGWKKLITRRHELAPENLEA